MHSADRSTPSDAPSDSAEAIAQELLRPRSETLRPSRAVWALLSLALLVALLLWLLPLVVGASWTEISAGLGALPPWVLLAALALGALAFALEALALRAAVPGSPAPAALQAHGASMALTLLVPGGSLLGIGAVSAILHRRGLPLGAILTGIVTFSVADIAIGGIAVPLAGVLSYAALSAGTALPGTWVAVLVALLGALLSAAAVALLAHRAAFLSVLETVVALLDRGAWGAGADGADGDAVAGTVPAGQDGGTQAVIASALAVRDGAAHRLRNRGAQIALPLLLARALQLGALALAIHASGFGIGAAATVGVFLVARTVALVPLTPGGGGLTEAAAAAVLVALGMPGAAAATSALVLSLATLAAPLLLGAACGLTALLVPGRRGPGMHEGRRP